LNFVPERDFAPISLVMNGPNVLVVHPSLPARNIKAFIALAKARPGDIKYTSAGAGTLPHLGMELLRYMTKINLLHVAYKGGGPALVALMAGECDASMYTLLSASAHLASGRLRAIGVTGKTRFNALPDVPTLAESGVPGYEFNAWVGVLAPAATPPAIIRLLNEHVVKAARSPVAAERLARDGAEVVASTPDAFRTRIAADTALWAKVIKEMNLRAE
jgi:tripartite-type tricarboxylate transporter receptor subunit TctC